MADVVGTLKAYEETAARDAATFKDFPKEAAKAGDFYKLPENLLPEGMKLQDGEKFTPNTDLLSAALPIFHKHRISPEAFNDLARAYSGFQLAAARAAEAEFVEDSKKLGDNGPQRRQAVNDGFKALIGDKWTLDANLLLAESVEIFEAILGKLTRQSTVIPFDQRRNNDPPPQPDKPLIDRLSETMYPKKAG